MMVKKYGNRRLYDTDRSRYITLEDLAERLRAGEDVEVIDAKTEQDLTQATLAQIILESRGAARLLPVPLLKQLIRMGDDALAEFFGRYIAWSLELYLEVRRGAHAIAPLNPLASALFAPASALARVIMGGVPWAEPPQPQQQPPPRSPGAVAEPPPQEDIASLRRELEELKRAVRRRDKKEP